MSRWPNRFVSLCALALLTACQSAPAEKPPTTAHETAESGGTAAAGTGLPGSALAGSAAGPPVPAQAAQQYSEALKLMKAGRTADAESALKQLASAYPEFAGPDVNLGLLYLQGAHLVEAESAFKTALERNPTNAIAGNELGITERKLGKFAEAEAAYQRTIAADPNYAPAYLNLGVLYDLYLAEPQKALEQFEHYVQLAGENKQVAGWMVELRKRVGAPAPGAKKESA